MTAPDPNFPETAALPEAVISPKRQLSIIWVIPVIAALIGIWLAWRAIATQGPEIIITFQSAEGLEAGKTKIRYKEVEIGQVAQIQLSEDLAHIEVTARLVKQAESFLSQNTRFWVVRARVAAGEVSGLDTVFSGAYIGLDPGPMGEPAKKFAGLEIPPIVTGDLPGQHFSLRADQLGSLDVGAPVYYRQIKVGQVVAYQLAEDGRSIDIQIFIHAPHHARVHTNTRFWNASGLDISLDARGIKVNTESMVTLMFGGLAFDTPSNLEAGGAVDASHVFQLYPNYAAIYEITYAQKTQWMLYFSGSVRGLTTGAPVEFRGIKIGQVLDVKLEFDTDAGLVRIPVLIEMEPDRIAMTGEGSKAPASGRWMDFLVAQGLRAQLRTGNLLTGQLFVSLDLYPDVPKRTINWKGPLPELPTIPTPIEEITASLSHLLHKIEQLPLQEMGQDIRNTLKGASQLFNGEEVKTILATLGQTMTELRQLADTLNTRMAPELVQAAQGLNQTLTHTRELTGSLQTEITPALNATLAQTQKSLQALQRTLSPESPLQHDLTRTLNDLSAAARSLRNMTDYLERHPDALIRGKGASK